MATLVRGALLRWAAERSKIPRSKLLAAFPRLPAWEKGSVEPSLRQLERFAQRTRTPLGHLFLETPPPDDLPIPDLRSGPSAGGKPSPDLLETIQTMILRQLWMRDLLEENGSPAISFVGSASLSNPHEDVAASIRKELGLGAGWASTCATWVEALRVLRQLADRAGILVFLNGVVGNNTSRPLNPDEFKGFAVADEYAPLVFINGADFKAAQMFTLAHELVHLWVNRAGVSSFSRLQPADNAVEKFCDAVAAEVLVPAKELRVAWRSSPDPEAMARRFKVSSIVCARRARDLGLWPAERFFQFYDAYAADQKRRAAEAKKKKKGGGDFYRTQIGRVGVRFGLAIWTATREGRLLYADAYRLTDLHGRTFDKYFASLGVGVQPRSRGSHP